MVEHRSADYLLQERAAANLPIVEPAGEAGDDSVSGQRRIGKSTCGQVSSACLAETLRVTVDVLIMFLGAATNQPPIAADPKLDRANLRLDLGAASPAG